VGRWFRAYERLNGEQKAAVDEVLPLFVHPETGAELNLADGTLDVSDISILVYFNAENETGYGLIFDEDGNVRTNFNGSMKLFAGSYQFAQAYEDFIAAGGDEILLNEILRIFTHSRTGAPLDLSNGLTPDIIAILGDDRYGLIFENANTVRTDFYQTMQGYEAIGHIRRYPPAIKNVIRYHHKRCTLPGCTERFTG
jgi:hypothetical protein